MDKRNDILLLKCEQAAERLRTKLAAFELSHSRAECRSVNGSQIGAARHLLEQVDAELESESVDRSNLVWTVDPDQPSSGASDASGARTPDVALWEVGEVSVVQQQSKKRVSFACDLRSDCVSDCDSGSLSPGLWDFHTDTSKTTPQTRLDDCLGDEIRGSSAQFDTPALRLRCSLDAFERAHHLDETQLATLSHQPSVLRSKWSVPVLSEKTQQKLEYGLPTTLSVLGWVVSFSWIGHMVCLSIVVIHTILTAVTDFGPAAASMRITTVLTPMTHHFIDVCLIGGLALSMHLFPSEFGSFPKTTSFALISLIPPYLLISFKTLSERK
jgi:hypothetical protein